jgi:pimeloyl-ACP methyl ester carboxylesterase
VVLDAVAGDDSAYVFGSSSGAITGLELLVRHPERIRLLIAHEPPAVELDVAALVALEDQLIPAVGSEPSEVLTVEPILALSDRVGWKVIAFPGGHGGYAERPFEFASLLLKVLANGGLR